MFTLRILDSLTSCFNLNLGVCRWDSTRQSFLSIVSDSEINERLIDEDKKDSI